MALIVLRFHWGWIEIWNVDFWGGSKTEGPGEKNLEAKTRINDTLNSHVTLGSGIEARPQKWEARTLTTTPSLLPKNIHAGNGGTIFEKFACTNVLHIVLGSTLCDHSYDWNGVESGRYQEAYPSSLHHQSRQRHDTYRNHKQSCR